MWLPCCFINLAHSIGNAECAICYLLKIAIIANIKATAIIVTATSAAKSKINNCTKHSIIGTTSSICIGGNHILLSPNFLGDYIFYIIKSQ